MAKCVNPKCNKNWFWDWEQDCYRYIDGSEVEGIYHSYEEGDEHADAIIFRCKCGAINSSMFTDNRTGSSVLIIEKWKNITWEEDGNAWDKQCLNCENISCLNDEKDYCRNINCSYNNVEG